MIALLVEDNVSRMAKIKEQLESLPSLDVLTATDGREALKILHAQKVDVILSDSNLPFMDGYRLAMDVKKDTMLKGIKFLLYSGRQILEDNVAYAKRIGVDLCLSSTEPEEIKNETLNYLST